jgi:hemerythrin superfamily protein
MTVEDEQNRGMQGRLIDSPMTPVAELPMGSVSSAPKRGSLWPPSTRRPAMALDAVELIKSDHRKVEQLFRGFEEAGDRAYKTKQELVGRIVEELEVHATIEEEIYYPAVEAKARKDGKELIAEAVEEHHVVKILLGELGSMSSEDEAFDAKVTVLMENVRHHVEEEEGELLPQSEKILGTDELTRLGEQMAARKQQLGAG